MSFICFHDGYGAGCQDSRNAFGSSLTFYVEMVVLIVVHGPTVPGHAFVAA